MIRQEGITSTKLSRAERAGIDLGVSIIKVVHLMYQNTTALNFLNGLSSVINPEIAARKSNQLK